MTAGGNDFPVGMERHLGNDIASRKRPERAAGHDVPDASRLVRPAGKQALAVRAERQGKDPRFMAAQRGEFLGRARVPDLDLLVFGAAGKRLDVRSEGDTAYKL